MAIRFVIRTKYGIQNFLTLKETQKKDVIVSSRGKHHSVPWASPEALQPLKKEGAIATESNITIHPNLKSKIGSVTINFKDNIGGNQDRKVAHVIDVKSGALLFPILTSVGRDIGSKKLNIDFSEDKYRDDEFVELWKDHGIDMDKDSLAYMVAIANKDIQFNFPECFPRNIVVRSFEYFQIIFMYWLFNQPTKERETKVVISTAGAAPGFPFHEVLNYTNHVTLMHMEKYDAFPMRMDD